jgi:predicted membrane-bound dolichyl-phosphate-mannose-protein mannosyltransferase
MSAGGQNSTTLSGITGMRIKDSSDVLEQTRLRQIYQLFNTTTPNAVRPRIPNGNGLYLQYLEGLKEVSSNVNGYASCTTCAGLNYNGNRLILTYRNGNFPPV